MKFIFYLKLINIRAKNSKPTRLQESAPLENLLHSAAHLIYLCYPNIPPKFPYRIGCVLDMDMHLIWTRYVSEMPVGISGYMAYPFSFDTVQQLIRAYKDTWHIPCPSIHYRIRLIRAGYSRDIDGIHFKFLGFQFSPLDVQSKKKKEPLLSLSQRDTTLVSPLSISARRSVLDLSLPYILHSLSPLSG